MLFVYGTLRQGSGHPMARLMQQHARLIGAGSFRGKLFLVDHYPGVVPSDDPNDRVLGEVYELTRARWLLALLDEYEGYRPQSPECDFVRRVAPVTLADGATLAAWIYVYTRPTLRLRRIYSGDFITACSSSHASRWFS